MGKPLDYSASIEIQGRFGETDGRDTAPDVVDC